MHYIVYFPCDQQVALLPEADVMLGHHSSLNQEDWQKMDCQSIKVTAVYDCTPFPAYIIMAVPDDDDDCVPLLEKLRSVIIRKKLSETNLAKFCGTRWKTARRLKVHPIQVLQTETSCASTDDENNSSQSPQRKSKESMPSLPPITLPSAISTPKRSVGAVNLVFRGNECSMEETVSNRDRLIPKVSQSAADISYGASVNKTYLSLLETCRQQGMSLESREVDRFLLATLVKENIGLKSEIRNMNDRLAFLESRMYGYVKHNRSMVLPEFPIFKTVEEFNETENHPKNFSWMSREGGRDVQEHVYRVLDKLIGRELQAKINRPGLYGKEKFHMHLEEKIKESAMSIFPTATSRDVELKISKFFNGVRDRHGGRKERMKKGSGENIHEPNEMYKKRKVARTISYEESD